MEMIALQYGLQYGLPFAIELLQTWENKNAITSADLIALHAKYGTKTAAEYLKEAQVAIT